MFEKLMVVRNTLVRNFSIYYYFHNCNMYVFVGMSKLADLKQNFLDRPGIEPVSFRLGSEHYAFTAIENDWESVN